jgi:arylformamidase
MGSALSLDPVAISQLMRQAEEDYNLRRRHPERERLYADYALRSERLRRERGCVSLAYGTSARCTMDWFEARATAGNRPPLLVFFHGGFWRGGDKATFGFLAQRFLDAGISVALAGYDLAPSVSVTEIVRQAGEALRHLFRDADALGFDLARVTESGHSAGAHLAAILGSEQAGSFEGGSIAGVVGLSGLYSLQPFLLSSVNLETRMTLQEAEDLSPAIFDHFSARRFLLAVGADETSGFVQQSRDFAAHLRALGKQHELLVCEQRTHFDIFEEIASADSVLLRRMLAQISEG